MWSLLGKSYAFIYNIFNQVLFFNLFTNWFLNSFYISKVDEDKSDINITTDIWKKNLFLLDSFLFWLDYIYLYFFSKIFSKKSQLMSVKVNQFTTNKFYLFNNNNNVIGNLQTLFLGLKSIWKHIRLWVLPITFLILFVYYSFFLKSLPFSKFFFGYLLVGNMFYLLLSGFVFFIKKYQYRLYTSVIQRFWRRTLIIFWLIEGSLFTVFVYLIFNASQEPVHVYDNIQIYKTHFYSWRFFLIKIISSSILIILTYMLLLSIKWNTFTKTNNLSLFITILVLYIAWLEFYQLFHLMNCYGTSNWVYDISDHLWNLELDFKRTRIVNHYVTIGLVAKFWHVVFAVIFWIFFLLRGLESSRYRYPLLSANLQNFLIIYVMSWLYMYPWFKYTFRKSLDMPYFWFFVNNRKLGVFLFFNDIKLYFWGITDIFNNFFTQNVFKNTSFYYWHESSFSTSNSQFRKHYIRDLFIKSIY
jgi:hypothetical protein